MATYARQHDILTIRAVEGEDVGDAVFSDPAINTVIRINDMDDGSECVATFTKLTPSPKWMMYTNPRPFFSRLTLCYKWQAASHVGTWWKVAFNVPALYSRARVTREVMDDAKDRARKDNKL